MNLPLDSPVRNWDIAHAMTRTGKIARLPLGLRQQLNRRLLDGESAAPLLAWLNSLPQVREILAAQFDAQPISVANLSKWKRGGFLEWQAQESALEATRGMLDATAAVQDTCPDSPLSERLALFCAARLAAQLQSFDTMKDGPKKQARWQSLCSQVATLRRCDQAKTRLQVHATNAQLAYAARFANWEGKFWLWAKKPKNEQKIRRLFKLTGDETQQAYCEIFGIRRETLDAIQEASQRKSSQAAAEARTAEEQAIEAAKDPKTAEANAQAILDSLGISDPRSPRDVQKPNPTPPDSETPDEPEAQAKIAPSCTKLR